MGNPLIKETENREKIASLKQRQETTFTQFELVGI